MTEPTQSQVPMLNLTDEIERLWPELTSALTRVLRSGRFVLGSEVAAFEEEVARYLGVKHAVGLNSGTDALVIGLRALGVGPGDEVITTSFSFFATAEAIVNIGAIPVFVDVEEESFNIDPNLLEAVLGPRTKAIVPVHLFGRPAAMNSIMEVAEKHGLKVLEDCAQSFGAFLSKDEEARGTRDAGGFTGAIGDAGSFSFYPTKNLGAYGDAGLLTTNDDEVASLARMLRNHGASQERRYENQMPGYNSRLDEFQAAILRVKLPHVDEWNGARRRVAQQYHERLQNIPRLTTPGDVVEHVYHQYTIRLPKDRRSAVVAALDRAGIASAIFYPQPLHRLVGDSTLRLPVSERLCDEVLSLPIWPEMRHEGLARVCEVIRKSLMSESS